MKHLGWPRPPLILGFVLGGIFERYFFISTEIYGAAWVLRPVVLAVFAAALWVVVPPLKRHARRRSAATFGSLQPRRACASTAMRSSRSRSSPWSGRRCAFSLPWPAAAKFVPHAAAYAALFFAGAQPPDRAVRAGARAPRRRPAPQPPCRPRPRSTCRARSCASGRCAISAGSSGFLVRAAVIGLLPALFLFVLLQMRLEFGERWMHAVAASCLAAIADLCAVRPHLRAAVAAIADRRPVPGASRRERPGVGFGERTREER